MIDSMLSNDSSLCVRRVRSYRVPRYPSHTDPDPTTNPEPVPYPWKSGVAAALLALGDASCGAKETTVSTVVDEIVADALREKPKGEQNPFAQSLGLSGLPYVSSPFGTGAPTTLDNAVAQKLITQICTAEGLKMRPTTFTEKDFTASAQLYDPEKRIGFIIGDWENLGDGAMINWTMRDYVEVASGKKKLGPEEVKPWSQMLDQNVEGLAETAGLSDELKQSLAAIQKLDSPQAKAQAFLDFIAKRDMPKLSMAEIKHAEKMAEEHQRYLAVITVFDRRFESFGSYPPGFQERFAAVPAESKKRDFANDNEKMKWIEDQNATIYAEMQREQLVKLAQSVREYIAWARRSGLQ